MCMFVRIVIIVNTFFQECMISDCGELATGEDDGICSADDSGDQTPDWPEDSQLDFSNVHTFVFDFFQW